MQPAGAKRSLPLPQRRALLPPPNSTRRARRRSSCRPVEQPQETHRAVPLRPSRPPSAPKATVRDARPHTPGFHGARARPGPLAARFLGALRHGSLRVDATISSWSIFCVNVMRARRGRDVARRGRHLRRRGRGASSRPDARGARRRISAQHASRGSTAQPLCVAFAKGRRDETCPVSTGGGTRRVRLVREGGTRRVRLVREGGGGGGGGACQALATAAGEVERTAGGMWGGCRKEEHPPDRRLGEDRHETPRDFRREQKLVFCGGEAESGRACRARGGAPGCDLPRRCVPLSSPLPRISNLYLVSRRGA